MASVWLRVNRSVSAAFVPALLGLAVVSSDFVVVALGEQWGDVAPLLQIMSLGMIAYAVSLLGAEVLKALGDGTLLLRFYVVETVVLLLGIVVGIRWGVVGVAAAFALVSVPARAIFAWLTARALAVPFSRFLASLGGVAQASLVLVVATFAIRLALTQTGAPAWLRLTLTILVGVVVYLPLCLWRVPELRSELDRLWREAGNRRRLVTAPDA